MALHSVVATTTRSRLGPTYTNWPPYPQAKKAAGLASDTHQSMPYVTLRCAPTEMRHVKCGRVTESTQLCGTTLAGPDQPPCRYSWPSLRRSRARTAIPEPPFTVPRSSSSHATVSTPSGPNRWSAAYTGSGVAAASWSTTPRVCTAAELYVNVAPGAAAWGRSSRYWTWLSATIHRL